MQKIQQQYPNVSASWKYSGGVFHFYLNFPKSTRNYISIVEKIQHSVDIFSHTTPSTYLQTSLTQENIIIKTKYNNKTFIFITITKTLDDKKLPLLIPNTAKKTPDTLQKQPPETPVLPQYAQIFEKKLKLLANTDASSPILTIIIDDIGYNIERVKEFLDIEYPITYAVIPFAPHGKEVAQLITKKQKPILIHMPMEPISWPRHDPGPQALFTNDATEDIQNKILQGINIVPQAGGMNNHMGSKFINTEKSVHIFFQTLKKKGLFFVDSKTIQSKVAQKLAQQYNIKYYARDVFLDNNRNEYKIMSQLLAAAWIAKKKGTAIALGHPYAATRNVLRVCLPLLVENGFLIKSIYFI